MSTDLKDIRDITANFHYMKGLMMVPLGICNLLIAVLSLGWVPQPWLLSSLLCALLAAFFLLSATDQYYKKIFGSVQVKARVYMQEAILATVSIVALLIAMFINTVLWLPVNVCGLVLAAILLIGFWRGRRYGKHYIVMAAIIAALSLLPPLGAMIKYLYATLQWPIILLSIQGNLQWFFINGIVGIIMIIGGLLDHRELVRSMTRTQKVMLEVPQQLS